MKRVILAILFVFQFSCAYAGEEFEKFIKDMATLSSEQSKTPDKIIKYSDSNGEIARAVLNPERVVRIQNELKYEINPWFKLKLMSDQYAPIATNYDSAVRQFPGQYDAEYMDLVECVYHLANNMAKLSIEFDRSIARDDARKPLVEEISKKVQIIPVIALKKIEAEITENRFSPTFTPKAIARLKQLQEERVLTQQ